MSEIQEIQRQLKRTTLYRLYDAQNVLLYVGISKSALRRWGEHAQSKSWWTQVARTTTEHFETREAAAEAELRAIRTENPVHNVTGRLIRPVTKEQSERQERLRLMKIETLKIRCPSCGSRPGRKCTKTIFGNFKTEIPHFARFQEAGVPWPAKTFGHPSPADLVLVLQYGCTARSSAFGEDESTCYAGPGELCEVSLAELHPKTLPCRSRFVAVGLSWWD